VPQGAPLINLPNFIIPIISVGHYTLRGSQSNHTQIDIIIAVCVFILRATLKMEAAGTSVTSVHFYQTIRHHVPVHINFRNDTNSINHDCRRRSLTKFSRRSVPAGYFKRTVQPDDWLTVHRSRTLVDLQLDAQLTFLQSDDTRDCIYTITT